MACICIYKDPLKFYLFQSGKQRISKVYVMLLVGTVAFTSSMLVLTLFNFFLWLTFLVALSYLKVLSAPLKFTPQVSNISNLTSLFLTLYWSRLPYGLHYKIIRGFFLIPQSYQLLSRKEEHHPSCKKCRFNPYGRSKPPVGDSLHILCILLYNILTDRTIFTNITLKLRLKIFFLLYECVRIM